MQGEILLLFGTALAAGIAELLLPTSEEGGTGKLFRFLISLAVLLIVLSPFLRFLRSGAGMPDVGDMMEETRLEEYEQIFSDAVQAQSKEELEAGLRRFLETEFQISPQNVQISTRFDAAGALVGVDLRLSGTALLKDPAVIEKALREKLNCKVGVR